MAGGFPCPAVDAFGQLAARFAAEQPAVSSEAEFSDVGVRELGERRGAWGGPDFLGGAVFELAAVAAGAGVGPCPAGGGADLRR